MSFIDCYKNIIYTLCNLENWVGPTAMWIDSCDKSNDEDITLYEWTPVDTAKLNEYWEGGALKTECNEVASLSSPRNPASEMVNKLIFYAIAKYMKKQ